MSIPKRRLGKTEEEVTIFALGGEGVLRTVDLEKDAYAMVNKALDLGINHMESARAYSGSEEYYGDVFQERIVGERRKEIFLATKSHDRTKKGAEIHLQESLRNFKTDYIDLWQVHDMRTEADIEQVFGKGGAIEAFSDAKEKGLVRFLGVTGHHDPEIVKKCIEIFDFDTVLMPVNPAEIVYKSFIESVLPVAKSKDMGIIAMKTYVRGFLSKVPGYSSMKEYFNYALSHDVSNAVIGCDSVEQVEENVKFAEEFEKMSAEDMSELEKSLKPYSRELMYYKPQGQRVTLS